MYPPRLSVLLFKVTATLTSYITEWIGLGILFVMSLVGAGVVTVRIIPYDSLLLGGF